MLAASPAVAQGLVLVLTRSPVRMRSSPAVQQPAKPGAPAESWVAAACTERHSEVSHCDRRSKRSTRDGRRNSLPAVRRCAILLRFTCRERGLPSADHVCPLAAAGSTPGEAAGRHCDCGADTADNGAQRRRGPSMYEMEGPRQHPAALASRLLGRRALRGACLAALASRLLRCRVLRGTTGVRFPTSAPVARPFHRSRGLPRGGSRLRW